MTEQRVKELVEDMEVADQTLQCSACDKKIVRDSLEHDECMIVNKGDDLICQDCPRVCEAKCGECQVCEDDSDEEEEELAGDPCYGASDPYKVIIYTMAGGGDHWWNYEVHYDDDGQQVDVYINNINGKSLPLPRKVIFYYEDQPDQLRLEDDDFDEDKWIQLEHYA